MAPSQVNILLSTFDGLDLPPTLSLAFPRSASIREVTQHLTRRLPEVESRWIISTISGKQVESTSTSSLATLLPSPDNDFLSLRLSVPLLGGKGGFGSQLRAAGGRMSSKRKKNDGDANGSSRNLDGRRLRTVTEAKALAELLSIKPEMERKEKERRRQRWEKIVEMTEQREQRIRQGSDANVDGKWMEAKEEAGERTRDAVVGVLKKGSYSDNLLGTSQGPKSRTSSKESSEREQPAAEADHSASGSRPATKARRFAGFEEEEDYMSSDEEQDDVGRGKE